MRLHIEGFDTRTTVCNISWHRDLPSFHPIKKEGFMSVQVGLSEHVGKVDPTAVKNVDLNCIRIGVLARKVPSVF